MANEVRVILQNARLAADPEQSTSKTGKPYLKIRVGVTPYRKTQTGIQNAETQWWNVVEFDEKRIGKILASLRKGDACRIEGTYTPKAYTDRNGEPRADLTLMNTVITKHLTKPKDTTNYGGDWEMEF